MLGAGRETEPLIHFTIDSIYFWRILVNAEVVATARGLHCGLERRYNLVSRQGLNAGGDQRKDEGRDREERKVQRGKRGFTSQRPRMRQVGWFRRDFCWRYFAKRLRSAIGNAESKCLPFGGDTTGLAAVCP